MFSVVIPAYNAEKFINTSVDSVLCQTYKKFELIIIDDGSTDDTRGVVEQYTDNRIRYIYQINEGVSAARNKGILESTGEFVCFLDSDDEWKENHLEELHSLIGKYSQCGIYITGYDIRLNNGRIICKSEQLLNRISDEQIESKNGFDVLLKNGYFFNTNTMCCRREVFDKVGLFAVGVKNGEDDDMWYRIFSYYSVALTKKSTTIYNRANCGATGNRTEVMVPFFFQRLSSIFNSPEVPQYRKDSLMIWAERNKLSRVRQNILLGNKREAWKLFKEIDFNKSNKKKYCETVLCMCIPSKFIRKHIDKRDAGYYK